METFTQHCHKPYDRHTYEVFLKNGKNVSFDNWEDTQVYWFNHCQIPDFLDLIIVKDKRNMKSSGFGA